MQEFKFIVIPLDQALDTTEEDPLRVNGEFMGEIWP